MIGSAEFWHPEQESRRIEVMLAERPFTRIEEVSGAGISAEEIFSGHEAYFRVEAIAHPLVFPSEGEFFYAILEV